MSDAEAFRVSNPVDSSVFKANDIRGVANIQIDARFAFLLGCSLVEELNTKRVVVGYDARLSSEELHTALSQGIKRSGGYVTSAGMCPTELLYYLVGRYGQRWDLAVMITASHNPPEYNGFKIIGSGATPFVDDSTFERIFYWMEDHHRLRVADTSFSDVQSQITYQDFLSEYVQYCLCVAGMPDTSLPAIVVDPGNGVGGLLWEELERQKGIRPIKLNFQPDGRFPAHPPDPSKSENLNELVSATCRQGKGLGLAYDGDSDRVFVTLPNGRILDGNSLTALLSTMVIHEKKDLSCAVSMDTRRATLEFLEKHLGNSHMVPIGHTKIKRQMAASPQVRFAGEPSGHYFYQDFYRSESSLITTLLILKAYTTGDFQMVLDELRDDRRFVSLDVPLHENTIAETQRRCVNAAESVLEQWSQFDEIMYELDDTVRHTTRTPIPSSAQSVRIDYPDWWVCIRPSQTEPLIRIYVESDDGSDPNYYVQSILKYVGQ